MHDDIAEIMLTQSQIVRDGVTHRLGLALYPYLGTSWWKYLSWVEHNYQPHLKNITILELVNMHLADLGLTRSASISHIYLHGSQEDLTAWMLTYA